MIRQEQAWQRQQELYNAQPCKQCPHTRGRHAVDFTRPVVEIRDGELVEVEPSGYDTTSCRVDGCGCSYPTPLT